MQKILNFYVEKMKNKKTDRLVIKMKKCKKNVAILVSLRLFNKILKMLEFD